MRPHQSNKVKGITLIELAFVVVMLGIIVILALNTFSFGKDHSYTADARMEGLPTAIDVSTGALGFKCDNHVLKQNDKVVKITVDGTVFSC